MSGARERIARETRRARAACVLAVVTAATPARATSAARSLDAPAGGAPVAVQELVRVEGRVTSVAGSSIYVDVGRDDAIEPGDRALLHPPGVGGVEGTIRSVARRSARLELEPGSPPVREGTRVEVLVPRERVAKPAPPPPSTNDAGTNDASASDAPLVAPKSSSGAELPPKPPPVHPPWTHPPVAWSEEHPLLAPAFGLRPEERARDVHGRAWIDWNVTTDSTHGSKRYVFGRTGADVHVTNPFGAGGELVFDAELQHRSFAIPDGEDERDADLVLRRFSYRVGDTPDEPTRVEVGRFLAHELPELGVVDGVEWTRRTESGSRFGFHAGGLPEPFPGRSLAFHDVGVAAFGRFVTGAEEELRLGGALQSTWHDGRQDRTSVLGEAEWRPSPRFAWRTFAWVDHYDSNDALKSPGFELTELSSRARWRFADDWGVAASASHRRYPELLRDDYASLSPALVRDGEIDRGSLAIWHELSPRTRVDARVDAWKDQDDDGTALDVGVAWRDLLYDRGTVSLALFRADGTFSSGVGARASATRSWERAFGMLSYELTTFDQKDFTGAEASLAHHAVFGTLDVPIGELWSLSLRAEDRFGDEQDAWSLGFLLQLRY